MPLLGRLRESEVVRLKELSCPKAFSRSGSAYRGDSVVDSVWSSMLFGGRLASRKGGLRSD